MPRLSLLVLCILVASIKALNYEDLPHSSHLRQQLDSLNSGARSLALERLASAPHQDHEYLNVIEDGSLYYTEPVVNTWTAPPRNNGTQKRDLSQLTTVIPAYHSRPGAPNVAYMDFTGTPVTGTAWNSQLGLSTINCGGWTLDDDPTTYTTEELAAIYDMWSRSAEDYRPFNIDITTERPAGASTTWSPQTIHALICLGTTDTPSGTTTGGISFMGIFGQTGNSYYLPSFVYYNNLGNDVKYIADATSHEFGHTFNLHHDGTTTPANVYYEGTGTGPTSWAPIMGASYYKTLSQWSKGEYPYANNLEDDMAIISSNLGYASATSTSWTISYNVGTCSILYTGTGVIRNSADSNTWSLPINPPSGFVAAVQLTALPWYSNWDPSNSLYNGNNLDISMSFQGTTSSHIGNCTASATYTGLPTGTYSIVISPSGENSAYTSFTTYASAGSYTLSACVEFVLASARKRALPTRQQPITSEDTVVVANTCSSGACCNMTTGTASSAGTMCRPTAGPCDLEEYCDGINSDCPQDVFIESTVICRPSFGPCDAAETCPGNSADCPADHFHEAGYVCGNSVGPCASPPTCSGNSIDCPTDAVSLLPWTTVCRQAAGPCDIPENCTGTSTECPIDILQTSTSVCRPIDGPCDVEEKCTGYSAQCPSDEFAAPTTVCRQSRGSCDLEEICSGNSKECPIDVFAPLGTPCVSPQGTSSTCQYGTCL